MKIAQVAPLYESVPPKLYGGTERVVSYLTEELVAMGHDITLFASGDSITSAHLVAPCPQSLRLDKDCIDQLAHHILMLEQVFQRAPDYDIIHFHCDYLHFPWTRRHQTPTLTTLHGRLDFADLIPLYKEFVEMPLISISNAQRQPLPWVNWQGTVYHGLPPDLYRFQPNPGKYLAALGRISPEKGFDKAIEIAKRIGIQLRIAAKVDRVDEQYFKEVIQPLLDHPLIQFVGEIGEEEKEDFLGNAIAVLCPLDWPEPFGLVMIEAMACGTPVIAFRCGSVPEVIDDGQSGFIVQTADEAVEALKKIPDFSRANCRQVFDRRFTASRMAKDYVRFYRSLVGGTAAGTPASQEDEPCTTSSA